VSLVTVRSRLNSRERLLVSWVGLRGAALIVLATFPPNRRPWQLESDLQCGLLIVLTSGRMQGTSIRCLANRLGLAERSTAPRIDPLELVTNDDRDIVEFSVGSVSPVKGRRIVDLSLPPDTLVLLIDRKRRYIIPRGSTTIDREDRLVVTANGQLPAVQQALGA
jgi:cell volume regulation protein A